jgi:hypothetical protein
MFPAHERRGNDALPPRATSAGERINQHPRQRVFSFVSNFLFSTSSMSTYGALSSVGVLGAGLSIGPLIAAGWSVAVVVFDVLGLPRVCGGAVPL